LVTCSTGVRIARLRAGRRPRLPDISTGGMCAKKSIIFKDIAYLAPPFPALANFNLE
jgi:hypothetical protein